LSDLPSEDDEMADAASPRSPQSVLASDTSKLKAPSQEPGEASAARATKPRSRVVPTLKEFLQAAKPKWKSKDVTVVLEKLIRAGIHTTPELLSALKGKGNTSLNVRLKAVEEKTLTADTLQQLREYAEAMAKIPAREEDAPPVAAAQLPTQDFEVVPETLAVLETPSPDGPVLGTRARGELVHATEETFDGFVRLLDGQGWMPRYAFGGPGGSDTQLLPLGKPLLLVERPLPEPSPWRFRVAFKPTVAVRDAPCVSAKVIGTKSHGEEVLAEVQSYHGWIRLVGGSGWMLGIHSEYGRLIEECVAPQAQGSGDHSLPGPGVRGLDGV